MGVSIKKALSMRSNAVTAVRDLYSTATAFKLTANEINIRFRAIVGAKLGKAPHWAKSYVEGYRQCLNDELYRSALVFGCWVDGKFYSNHRNRADYYETQGMSPSIYSDASDNGTRGHYWMADTSKPYFIG